ncbi:hypothetical protein [Paenibacillus turpanensis]|uniref:hypothetical protein n=1 Tax=Paenibacillus turpanensis TaxID=2689078 RepID=UPI001409C6E2|nr:hypothetical protein [Paenibacillus turpanensis]
MIIINGKKMEGFTAPPFALPVYADRMLEHRMETGITAREDDGKWLSNAVEAAGNRIQSTP